MPPSPDPVPSDRVDRVLTTFAAYLKRERALAEATIDNYSSLVEGFLRSPSSRGRVEGRLLRPTDVHRFLLHYVRRGTDPARVLGC